MRDRVFFSICVGFIFGVLLRSFFVLDIYFALAISVIGVFLLLFFLLISKNTWGTIFSIFVFAFCLGIFRFDSADRTPPEFFESRVGEEVMLEGEIIDGPVITENTQRILIKAEDVKVLVSTDFDTDYAYGDRVLVKGTLEKPENFITDQGKEFDYINYLKKDGIFYTMYFPDIEVVSTGHGNRIKRALFYLKNKFLEKINLAIGSPENLLMGGLILGEKSAFPEEMRQSFVDTGTIHIVALSGYNITLVADWFMKLFSYFPRNLANWAGIFSIALFIVMTGTSSTALRAGLMAALALYARASGRNYDAARALLLAGVLMIAINPYVLAYDVSFQLSFMATFALIFFTPKVEKYFLWVPKRCKLREIASTTFAVYIFVFPFILYKMGNLSLVALPANMLVLPLIPPIMVLGFITGLLGMIHYILATPVGLISYLMLKYELGIIEFFSKIPFSSISIPDFPLWIVLPIYFYFTRTLILKIFTMRSSASLK